jgi:hypothetical protein
VNGSKRNDPHDEEVECALREVKPVVYFLHAYGFYLYTSLDVEGRGISAVSMCSGQLSVGRIRKVAPCVNV